MEFARCSYKFSHGMTGPASLRYAVFYGFSNTPERMASVYDVYAIADAGVTGLSTRQTIINLLRELEVFHGLG